MPWTKNLGKYLRVPIIHGRIKKDTYSKLLDNVHEKLVRWKSKCLSYAVRLVLAKVVLTAIPNYLMQTAVVPLAMVEETKKKCVRRFLWGDSEGKKNASCWMGNGDDMEKGWWSRYKESGEDKQSFAGEIELEVSDQSRGTLE